jgi:tripartite-type tricarboxylate transporter receptor subunit TctC
VQTCLLVAACLGGAAAHAQRYPVQPVRLIAAGPPASPSDIRARWVAEQLAPALGQPVVVENRAGAGGNIGAEAVAKSPADGYTLLLVHQGIVAMNPHLYSRTGFDPIKDFAPVTRIVDAYLVLAVPAGSPASSVNDLIRLARDKAGQLAFGSPGIGTPPHLASELFKRMAGIDVRHIPYKGATPALIDLIAGRIDFTLDSLSISGPQAKAGKLKALAVTSAQRLPSLPELPTIAESGVPDYEFRSWMGLVAPAGTPAAVVARLNGELVRVLRTREAQEYFQAQGGVPVGDSPDSFHALIRADHARWGKIIREAGIRAD